MKTNVSDHQFLEGDDIIVVQSNTDTDYAKRDTKNVKVESLREDIRNYVETTTTKELKVFRSNRTAAGGNIEVLDNETLYYYPATPVSSLNDSDITITSNGSYFDDTENQRDFNEKIYGDVTDINLTLESTNKFVDAIVASSEFDDADNPTHVQHFTNYNAYPPTPASPDRAEVVNKNDLAYVDTESAARDSDLQDQITSQEKRITALFNVKIDSGYFVTQTTDPHSSPAGPGQIGVDLNDSNATIPFSVHARSYTADYSQPEEADNATQLNNYIVVNPTDTIVTGNRTYHVDTVEVVDENAALEERVYNFTATLLKQSGTSTDGDFTTFRVVADGEFDPDSLQGEYVQVAGDTMTGQLDVHTSETKAITVGDADGNEKLVFNSDGSAITTKTTFTDQEFITKSYLDGEIGDIDFDDLAPKEHNHHDLYLKLTGGTLHGTLAIKRGDEKPNTQFKISSNGGLDYSTNIYSMWGGQMRFRTSKASEGEYNGSHIVLDPKNGNPETKIFNLVYPSREDHAANKKYVDDEITKLSNQTPEPPDLSGYVKAQNGPLTLRKSGSTYYIDS